MARIYRSDMDTSDRRQEQILDVAATTQRKQPARKNERSKMMLLAAANRRLPRAAAPCLRTGGLGCQQWQFLVPSQASYLNDKWYTYHTTTVCLKGGNKKSKKPKKQKISKKRRMFNLKFITPDYCRQNAWFAKYTNTKLQVELTPEQRRDLLVRLGVEKENGKHTVRLLRYMRNEIIARMPEDVATKESTAEDEGEDSNWSSSDSDSDDDEGDDDEDEDVDGSESGYEATNDMANQTPLINPYIGHQNDPLKFIDAEFALKHTWVLDYKNKTILDMTSDEKLELFERLGIKPPASTIKYSAKLRSIRQRILKRLPKADQQLRELTREDEIELFQNHDHAQLQQFLFMLGLKRNGGKAKVAKRLAEALREKVSKREWELLLEHQKDLSRYMDLLRLETAKHALTKVRRLDRVARQNQFILDKVWKEEWRDELDDLMPPEEFKALPWKEQVLYFRHRKPTLKAICEKVVPHKSLASPKIMTWYMVLLNGYGRRLHDF